MKCTTLWNRGRWGGLLVVAGLIVAAPFPCRAADAVLGPAQELKVLDDFGPDSTSIWKTRGSRNLHFDMAARSVPGVSDSLLQITFARQSEDI